MKVCPKCGREYSCPPAISREDKVTEICPVCGVAEAVEAAPISDKKTFIELTEKTEIEHGRVKAL